MKPTKKRVGRKTELFWLNTLYEIVRDVNSTLGLKSTLKTIVEKAKTLLKVERASLMLLDKKGKTLTIHFAEGLSPLILRNTRIRIGEGVSGWVAQKGKPLLIQDISKDRRFKKKEGARYSTDSLLSVPLKVKGKTIGVLNVNNKRGRKIFTHDDLELLTALADEAAIAIHNATLYDELVQVNERLKELDKLKSDFVAKVSHELRTPLATTRYFITAVRGETQNTGATRQKEYLGLIEDNLDRLTRLIDNLLDFSKMEVGRFELKKERVDLLSIARSAIETLRRKGEEKEIALVLLSPGKVPPTYLDQDRMTQVVTNLVDNAIKYTPSKGSVSVEIKRGNGNILLTVRDTGVGIRSSDQERLFEKFRQLGPSIPHEKGVGLGLAIVKEIVILHKGKIWVKSQEGKGSTFTISLPVLSDEEFFMERLSQEIQKARENGDFLSLVILGIANFEHLKENIGEEGMESLLDEIARLVKETVRRPSDIVASYKQGKVIAILAGADKAGALALAERVKKTILSQPFPIKGSPVSPELQFGIGTFPEDGGSQEELVKQAEKSLYGHS
ncbi:MAG: GAF domain-containing protein [Candidatus Omnitrophica bacterium]|nr:GAF domain-containing protein [Candidatus Omnitrophota bacterium]